MGEAGKDDRAGLKGRGPRKRSVVIAGHATSLTLEEEFWRDLLRVAQARGLSVNALVAAIDAERGGNLSSALRLFIRDCYRSGQLGREDDPPRP
jgi:predicted DNA-binding ribbon-helix-helix protein